MGSHAHLQAQALLVMANGKGHADQRAHRVHSCLPPIVLEPWLDSAYKLMGRTIAMVAVGIIETILGPKK